MTGRGGFRLAPSFSHVLQKEHLMEADFKHLHVEFFVEAVENKRKTAENGRPIFDEIEMIRMKIAGDPKTVHVAPAHDPSSARDPHTNSRLTYAQLHQGPYDAFKAGRVYVGEGTPLSELPWLTEAKRKELAALNIHTAEALAGLDGANLTRLGMGARELKTQAEAWLAKASGSADITRLSAENAALQARLEQLEAIVSAGNAPPVAAKAEATDASASPFSDWDEETIRLWITENGGENPHHKCSLATLIAKADELNAALAKKNKAA